MALLHITPKTLFFMPGFEFLPGGPKNIYGGQAPYG